MICHIGTKMQAGREYQRRIRDTGAQAQGCRGYREEEEGGGPQFIQGLRVLSGCRACHSRMPSAVARLPHQI